MCSRYSTAILEGYEDIQDRQAAPIPKNSISFIEDNTAVARNEQQQKNKSLLPERAAHFAT